MAGYSCIYCIGTPGGFMGSDGVNQIELQILQGEGGRRWFEAHYVAPEIGPLGRLKVVIPGGFNSRDALLDACIAFYRQPFEKCPSFASVAAEIGEQERLDFDLDRAKIPAQWDALRKEALPIFKSLHIYRAALEELDLENWPREQVL